MVTGGRGEKYKIEWKKEGKRVKEVEKGGGGKTYGKRGKKGGKRGGEKRKKNE